MRRCARRLLLCGTLAVAAGLLAVTGCSADHPSGRPASSSTRPAGIPSGPGTAPPGAVGLSPGGVTTRVDVPADSTEEEYYQACHAAKVWMDAQPRTGQSLFEPYLAMLQAAPSGTPGSWNARWADLTPARQAAVLTAARAAANDECG
ncbi:lipoprotein LpqV [Mycobacterium sp. E3305]|uniref:lipoprotein LpqV n=1 Tax=Mycobacterium sp. E3305 TaxID=1834145 RepID=UPI001E502AC3|nr:lipoprotein LpqV [Mycobacterium sp. E3305]